MPAQGFTLIELIVVIVLLGIVAVTFSIFISGTVGGYIDTARRTDSATAARIALDRMGRELREAMPLSVRVANNCIQFLPILGSSVYMNLPVNVSSFSVLNFSSDAIPSTAYAPATPLYAAIYPVVANPLSNDLYQLTSMKQVTNIGPFGASQTRTVTLAAASTYPRQSPAERVYFLGNPISYCLVGNALNRYTSAVTTAQPAVAALSNAALLLDNVNVAGSSFRYDIGNWRANGLVTINLMISRASSSGANEDLRLDHEVWIRNVE